MTELCDLTLEHALLEKLTLFPNASIVLENVDTHRSTLGRGVNAQTKRRHGARKTLARCQKAKTLERKVDLWPALRGREYAGVQTFPVDRKHSDFSKAPRNSQKVDLCVLASFSCRVYAETQGRKVRPVAGFSLVS